jgi:hypothetical protein
MLFIISSEISASLLLCLTSASMPASCAVYSSTLKREDICSSEAHTDFERA